MTTYMPPIARKKRVPAKYNPDSFRVISMQAEEQASKTYDSINFEVSSSDKLPEIIHPQVLPHAVQDFRANKPHASACSFLRHNAATLNEPVCCVHTFDTHDEQNLWWPSRTSKEPLKESPYTRDTTFREDFQFNPTQMPSRSMRNSSNPNSIPALGIAPVNFLRESDDKQRLWKENISYEHQYNCRIDPNYPVKAKRHGSFVWHKMSPSGAEKFVNYYSKQDEKRPSSHHPSQTGTGKLHIKLPHWLQGPYGEPQPESSHLLKQKAGDETQTIKATPDAAHEVCTADSKPVAVNEHKEANMEASSMKTTVSPPESDIQPSPSHNESPVTKIKSSQENSHPSSPQNSAGNVKSKVSSASCAHRESITVNNPDLVKSLLNEEPQNETKDKSETEE